MEQTKLVRQHVILLEHLDSLFGAEAEVEHACLVKCTEKSDVIALPNLMPRYGGALCERPETCVDHCDVRSRSRRARPALRGKRLAG